MTIAESQPIRWEEPPEVARNTVGRRSIYFTPEAADALKAEPGRWALLHDNAATGSVSQLRKKHAGVFEFTMRGMDKASRRGRLYARYIGEGGESR